MRARRVPKQRQIPRAFGVAGRMEASHMDGTTRVIDAFRLDSATLDHGEVSMPTSDHLIIHDELSYYLFLQAIRGWAKEMEQRTTPLSPNESALLVAANNFSAAEADAIERIVADAMKR